MNSTLSLKSPIKKKAYKNQYQKRRDSSLEKETESELILPVTVPGAIMLLSFPESSPK